MKFQLKIVYFVIEIKKNLINGFFTSYNETFSTLSDLFILHKKFVKKLSFVFQLSCHLYH